LLEQAFAAVRVLHFEQVDELGQCLLVELAQQGVPCQLKAKEVTPRMGREGLFHAEQL
jgi:hypothetical protein